MIKIKKPKMKTNDALFPFYIVARILKSVCFWIPISNFKKWKNDTRIIKKDFFFMLFSGVVSMSFFFFNWIYAILILIALIVLIYAFLFAMLKNIESNENAD